MDAIVHKVGPAVFKAVSQVPEEMNEEQSANVYYFRKRA
jgi:hypothetical protein